MPQSRHRKTGRARKRPRSTTVAKGTIGTTSRNERNVRSLLIVVAIAIVAGLGIYLVYTYSGGGAEKTLANGIKYVDTDEGNGPTPQRGQTLVVKYTGKLENGTVFDTSEKPGGKPYEFKLGMGTVIKGWDEGLKTMKKGGKRTLTIPPDLGYGAAGSPPNIPPNATLIFDVELVDIK